MLKMTYGEVKKYMVNLLTYNILSDEKSLNNLHFLVLFWKCHTIESVVFRGHCWSHTLYYESYYELSVQSYFILEIGNSVL